MSIQKTHRYHPIVQVSASWAELVAAEAELATRPPAERAERDRLRKREALEHEAQWAREGGPPWEP